VALHAELAQAGYAASSITDAVRAMARLSGSLHATGLTPGELTPALVEEFLAVRQQHSRVAAVARRALGPVLRFLRGQGVVPGRKLAPDTTPVEALLADYRAWLVAERGLAAESVRCYANQAKTFLTQLADPLGESLARLDAAAVTAFMVRHSTEAHSAWSAKALVTAMRSLLQFLHLDGLVPVPLAAAVPAVAGWRLGALPRGLQPGQVKALLAGCDTTTAVGLRDHAVLTVLARLGLRGAEVAALGLGDVDWRADRERLAEDLQVLIAVLDHAAGQVGLVDVQVPERALLGGQVGGDLAGDLIGVVTWGDHCARGPL
jgi:integrase/recombinase XerD